MKKHNQYKVISMCLIIMLLPILLFTNALGDTQSDYDNLQKELEALRAKQGSISEEFNSLNEKLTASGEKLSAIEGSINEKQEEIDRLEVDLTKTISKISDQKAAMKLRIKFMYEKNTLSTIDYLLTSTSLSDFLSKAEYIRKISQYDHEKLEELNTLMVSLNELEVALNEDMLKLKALKDSAVAEKNTLSTLTAQTKKNLDTNSESITKAEALALEYEKKIEAERIAREQAAIQALKESQKNNSSGSANTSNTGNNISDGSNSNLSTNLENSAIVKSMSFTQEEYELMAAIIECEAGNQSYEGKCAVGSVIMNRVISPRFGNSISSVVYAPYQFSPAGSGRLAIVLARGAMDSCMQAARDVLNGYINIDAYYFHAYNPAVDEGGTIIGDHIFY